MSKLSVFDIKLEIAKRIERMASFNPRDFGEQANLHNEGVMRGLTALFTWISDKQEEERRR